MRRLLPAAFTLAVCAALYSQTRHYALLGFDSHPLIASARVRSLADLFGLFGERLMDGRYPSAFYRPLVSLSIALDEALYGLDAAGYQLTNLALFGALAVAAAALVRRALGPEAIPAALIGSATLLLHSSSVEILPVAARRADTLCGLFMVLTLWAQLAPAERRRPWMVAAFAALAVAAKETGFVLAAIAPGLAWLRSGLTAAAPRRRAALLEATPVWAALAILLGARLAVLGGLGGHGQTTPLTAVADFPATLLTLAAGVVVPPDRLAQLPPLIAGACVLGIWGAPLVTASAAARETQRARLQLAALGLLWTTSIAAVYALGGWIGAWYWLLPAVGLAFGLAALADWAGEALALRRGGARVLPLAALAALAALFFAQTTRSPLVHRYIEWERASDASRGFLRELERRIADTPDGRLIEAPPLPMWVQPPADPAAAGPRVLGGAVLSDYSVQAWAELVAPGRKIRVLAIPGGALAPTSRTPAPDELVIALDAIAAGF